MSVVNRHINESAKSVQSDCYIYYLPEISDDCKQQLQKAHDLHKRAEKAKELGDEFNYWLNLGHRCNKHGFALWVLRNENVNERMLNEYKMSIYYYEKAIEASNYKPSKKQIYIEWVSKAYINKYKTQSIQTGIQHSQRKIFAYKVIGLLRLQHPQNEEKIDAWRSYIKYINLRIEERKLRKTTSSDKFIKLIHILKEMEKLKKRMKKDNIGYGMSISKSKLIRKEMLIRNYFIENKFQDCEDNISEEFLSSIHINSPKHENNYRLLKLGARVINSKNLGKQVIEELEYYHSEIPEQVLFFSMNNFEKCLNKYYKYHAGNLYGPYRNQLVKKLSRILLLEKYDVIVKNPTLKYRLWYMKDLTVTKRLITFINYGIFFFFGFSVNEYIINYLIKII